MMDLSFVFFVVLVVACSLTGCHPVDVLWPVMFDLPFVSAAIPVVYRCAIFLWSPRPLHTSIVQQALVLRRIAMFSSFPAK